MSYAEMITDLLLSTVFPAVWAFILGHIGEIFYLGLGIIGFLVLCTAIGSIGNSRPEQCPRHGCYLSHETKYDGTRVAKPCHLCVTEDEERRRWACRRCGGSMTGTSAIAHLCLVCQKAQEAYEAAEAVRPQYPELHIPL